MSRNTDKLECAYISTFGEDAPGCKFYYDSIDGWMWNWKAPQAIGENIGEALYTVRTSRAMELLLTHEVK